MLIPKTTSKLNNAAPFVLVILAGVAITLSSRSWLTKTTTPNAGLPATAGAITLLVLYVAYALFAGTWKLSALYRGADGRPSTSQFQALVWTLAAIFAYVGLLAVRLKAGLPIPPEHESIPSNLLLAMGFSFTTVAAAKGITVSYVQSGKVSKDGVHDVNVAQDDQGGVDLTKVQMLWWTFIGVGVYLVHLFQFFNTVGTVKNVALPDIDGALMVLMGLSHGVYIGKKLVTTDTPALNPLSVTAGPPGTEIHLAGSALGTSGSVTLDGIAIAPKSWSESEVVIVIPAQHPRGGAWLASQAVSINVIVAGRDAVMPVGFTVLLPTITSMTPQPMHPGQPLSINGSGFGVTTGTASLAGVNIAISQWTNDTITVNLPATAAAGQLLVVTAGTARTQVVLA